MALRTLSKAADDTDRALREGLGGWLWLMILWTALTVLLAVLVVAVGQIEAGRLPTLAALALTREAELIQHSVLAGLLVIWTLGMTATAVTGTLIVRRTQSIRIADRAYRQLFESLPTATFVLTIADGGLGAVREVNVSGERLLGRGRAEVIGRGLCDLVSECTPEIERTLAKTLEERENLVVEHRLVTQRGLVPVQVEFHRFDSAGRPAVLVMLRDLGDREAAEWVLRRRDAQLAKMSSATRLINEVLEEDEVLHRLAAAAMELLRAGECLAGLFDGGSIHYDGYRDLDGSHPLDLTLSADAAAVGEVTRSSGVFRTNDAPRALPRDPAFDAVFHPAAVLAAPILGRDGDLLGCVQLHDKVDGETFSEDDGFILLGLAASAAIALENARALRELRQMRLELLGGEERLRQLAGELSRTEERERRRVAEGLHDRIGQELAVMRMKVGQLVAEHGTDDGMTELRLLLERAIGETRELTFEISPPMLYSIGLDAAGEWLCEQIEQKHGIACVFRSELPPRDERSPLSDDVRGLLYRSLHELLMNVVKHAGASRAEVRLALEGERVFVTVWDDGAGFVPDERVVSDTFGLFSIRERLSAIGGTMSIASAPDAGCVVTLESPAHL